MSDAILLIVDGVVERPLLLELRRPGRAAGRSPDPGHLSVPPQASRGWRGARGDPGARPVKDLANYMTLHADRDDFHVSVPLQAVRAEGIVVYHRGGKPLGVEEGGPIRFLIRDPAACHTHELDDCANVKYLSRIELTVRRGRDTRPQTDLEHAKLHEGAEPGQAMAERRLPPA